MHPSLPPADLEWNSLPPISVTRILLCYKSPSPGSASMGHGAGSPAGSTQYGSSRDNGLVRQVLESPGEERVLVVDGGGSLRCALVGGRLASLARANGWAGLLINGSVRDSAELRQMAVGIRALDTVPRRSGKDGAGERGGSVVFAGVAFSPGRFLYADEDGILLAERDLLA
jgi:regulator of ribonuclease activity A